MKIYPKRAWDPTDMGDWVCELCELPFVAESVRGAEDGDGQSVCPSCIEYFGKRSPERFPTIEEYRDALRRFPEPIWSTEEELKREDPNWEYCRPAGYIVRSQS
jgi:hypothetical protein